MSHIVVMDDRICLLGSTRRTWVFTFALQELQELPIHWVHYSVQGLGGALFLLDASDQLWRLNAGMSKGNTVPLVSGAARHRAPAQVSSGIDTVLGLLTRLHIVVVVTKTHSNVFLESLGIFLASIDHATADFDSGSARLFQPLRSASSVAPPVGVWSRSGIWQLRSGKISDLLHRLATQAHSGADAVERLLIARHISARWSLGRWEAKVLLDLCVARPTQPRQLLQFANQLSNHLSSPVLIAEVLCAPMYRSVVTQMLADFSGNSVRTPTVSDETSCRNLFDQFSSIGTALAPTVTRFLETSPNTESPTGFLEDSESDGARASGRCDVVEDRNASWLQRCSEAELWRLVIQRPTELQEALESRLGLGSMQLKIEANPAPATIPASNDDARFYIELLICL
jgi:hypothetical protein